MADRAFMEHGYSFEDYVAELETIIMKVLKYIEPGVQFYSGNFLDGTLTGKVGKKYGHRSGFCLEPQKFPDSPNLHDKIPNYTSAKLDKGETYTQVSVFEFGIAE